MAFAVARYWGLLPHVVWSYPYRYYMELREFYIASLTPPVASEHRDESNDIDFDFDAEIFRGDSL